MRLAGGSLGQSYPTADRLKAFIGLCLQQHVFTGGQSVREEIRALWRAAHQKVLLDDLWLQELLSQDGFPSGSKSWMSHLVIPTVPLLRSLRMKPGWIGATRWMCRACMDARRNSSTLTVGGGGALSVGECAGNGWYRQIGARGQLMRQVAAHFEVVIWRSFGMPLRAQRCWMSACRYSLPTCCWRVPLRWKGALIC